MKTHCALSLTSVFLLFTLSCQQKSTEEAATEQISPATIELLTHTQGKFSVSESVTITSDQKDFTIGGNKYLIKNRWDDAVMTRETTNTNPREAHAVELAWSVKDKPESRWIFPTSDKDQATMLNGTTILPRLLPPGASVTTAEELNKSLLSGVQVEWSSKRYNIVPVGEDIFPGWKLAAVRLFNHALLNDSGQVTESDDTSFTNRAVEITIESKNGSTERHICFIDHPKLTAGIHPTLLPVTRITGDQASLSRLIVCESLEAPAEKSLVLISPDTRSKGLRIWTWIKGQATPSAKNIVDLPITLDLDGQNVEIKQHWTHARRQIKWDQREGASEKEKQPALLIEAGGHIHAKQFVLINGKSTPCKVTNDIIMLRYRNLGSIQGK